MEVEKFGSRSLILIHAQALFNAVRRKRKSFLHRSDTYLSNLCTLLLGSV